MSIGKTHALACQLIEMRRIDLTPIAAEAFDIAVAQIIRKNENHVRLGLLRGIGRR